MSQSTISKIAEVNDTFRKAGPVPTLATLMLPHTGRWIFTSGIYALGGEHIAAIVETIKSFDAFTEDNDPYGEHDFGSLTYNGNTIFWKFDYYDRNLEFGSPDPTDPEVTYRILTIMLAEEY